MMTLLFLLFCSTFTLVVKLTYLSTQHWLLKCKALSPKFNDAYDYHSFVCSGGNLKKEFTFQDTTTTTSDTKSLIKSTTLYTNYKPFQKTSIISLPGKGENITLKSHKRNFVRFLLSKFELKKINHDTTGHYPNETFRFRENSWAPHSPTFDIWSRCQRLWSCRQYTWPIVLFTHPKNRYCSECGKRKHKGMERTCEGCPPGMSSGQPFANYLNNSTLNIAIRPLDSLFQDVCDCVRYIDSKYLRFYGEQLEYTTRNDREGTEEALFDSPKEIRKSATTVRLQQQLSSYLVSKFPKQSTTSIDTLSPSKPSTVSTLEPLERPMMLAKHFIEGLIWFLTQLKILLLGNALLIMLIITVVYIFKFSSLLCATTHLR